MKYGDFMTKLVQIPDGLKRKALEIADEIGDAFIDCESCYGGCDLATQRAKALGCEKIVHYGHSKFIESDMPVEYVEIREDYNPRQVLEKDFNKLDGNKIGLVSSLQFLESLQTAKKYLEKRGKKAFIGKGKFKEGQTLGCDISSALSIEKNVDSFLFIGSGRFHALGLLLKTKKPVFVLDVEKNDIYNIKGMEGDFLKQRYVAQALAKDAKRFGILVSVKPGQLNLKLAEKIRKQVINKNKKAYILVFDEIKPEKLEGLDLDCYINTACPRIAIEDRTKFKKPILNPDEIEKFI